jgi:uncharacterized protein DUF3891
MIVRPASDGIQLITQPDHAHLARRIMEHCVPLANNPRRDAILHAIGEHDNGWAEEDAAPTINPDTGELLDFVNAPLAVRHSVWPRGVARLRENPWAAALVAQHAMTVYDRFRSDADWSTFFAQMEQARDALVRASELPDGILGGDYAFVRLGDLISLTFCTGWADEQRFGDWTIQRSGTRIVVMPEAFGGACMPFRITARQLNSQRFGSNAMLRQALSEASATTLHGEVAGFD